MAPRVTVATYNVHRCIGRDGVQNAERVSRIIRGLEADVVALQEVESRPGADADAHQLRFLADASGMHGIPGPTVLRPDSEYGNALLTRLPVREVRRLDLSVAGCEPRGAVDVDLDTGAGILRVLATHLGLRRRERAVQIDRLLHALAHPERAHVVLLGDINEWLPASRNLRRLNARLGRSPAVRTYPARCPLLALDRIWANPSRSLAWLARCDTALARTASDHLPVRARVRVGAE